ncbi:MAG TPA: hypothetical protein VE466_12710 [Acidimicrobiales bacterium]|nr:hypothetical protein [Acidimicrobiales bacterium]
MRPAPGANAWTHHGDFAARTEQLAGHLEATLALAEEGRFPSALALARTALEHHLLDRLLLLADRYEEIVRPPEPELLEEWEQAWAQKTERWTWDVGSIERVRSGKALRLVRLGHKVLDNAGKVREQISPYWVAMEHYDAFLGHPDVQALTVRPFDSLDERELWARTNQAIYGAFLRWGSICWNLELSELASRAEIVQLQVHYAFLSAFTHATKSGFEVDRRPFPNSPPASHVMGELALLYVATIAISEVKSWAAYVGRRVHLLAPLGSTTTDLVTRAEQVTAYFWFLGGHPQPFDYCQEANRRAHPLLLAGQPGEVEPSELQPADVGYYPNPFDRLQHLHTGGQELTTGFGFAPSWSSLHW